MTGKELILDDFAQFMSCKDGRHRDLQAWNHQKVECCLSCGSFYTVSSKLHSFLKFHDEIRILKLLPGIQTSDLFGELIHVRLRDQPIYDAVSYTWADESGDATCSSNLFIESRNGILKITRNCAAALSKFRDKQLPKFLWVDSICIDQCNLLERSEQVQLMTSIYKQAQTVKVFVGEPHDKYLLDYHELFEYIKAKTCWEKSPLSSHYRSSNLPLCRILSDRTTDDNTSMRIRNALMRFLGYSWFHRIWIIQEVAMSQAVTLYFGDFVIDWGDISLGAVPCGSSEGRDLAFTEVDPSVECSIPPVLRIRNNVKFEKAEFHELLTETRRCAATDPRDKIFALLGIARVAAELPLPCADYTKSVNQVFTEAAIYCIRSMESLSILSEFLSLGEFATSWVPDFSDTRFVRLLPLSSWPNWFNSRNGTGNVRFRNDNIAMGTGQTWDLTFINARGTLLDSIAYVQHDEYCIRLIRSMEPPFDKEGFIARFRELFHAKSTFQVPHSLLHCPMDKKDPLPFIEPSPGVYGLNMESVDLLAPFFEYKDFRGQYSPYCSAAFRELLELHFTYRHERAIFCGEYTAGIVPIGVEIGDQIWLLDTISQPLVLRQQGKNYKVIGPSMLISPDDCSKWCELRNYHQKKKCACKSCTWYRWNTCSNQSLCLI